MAFACDPVWDFCQVISHTALHQTEAPRARHRPNRNQELTMLMLLSFTAERGDAMSAKVYGGGAMSAKGGISIYISY